MLLCADMFHLCPRILTVESAVRLNRFTGERPKKFSLCRKKITAVEFVLSGLNRVNWNGSEKRCGPGALDHGKAGKEMLGESAE